MNFTHSVFYQLNEGTGTTISDSLGNGPAGTVAGTTTGIWANADCLTINNAQSAGGDNYCKLQSAYMDELLDISTLNEQSLVVMFWMNQPTPITSGQPIMLSYGQLLKAANADGAWGIACDNQMSPVFELRGGSSLISRGAGMIEPLLSTENNEWYAYGFQLDVFDGKIVASGHMGGRPQRGARMFDWEDYGRPVLDSSGACARLFAAALGASGAIGHVWGQTKFKRIFIGRTAGEQRNNIPKWAKSFHEQSTGICDFMVS